MSKNLLSILVKNKAGVLFRVSGMFMRRGYNIDNLTVSTTTDAQISRITAMVDADTQLLGQVIRQLNKLEDVITVSQMKGGIRREIALIKLRREGDGRDLTDTLNRFRAAVADIGADTITAEMVGDPAQIDEFVLSVARFGILEMVRSGLVALERGDGTLSLIEENDPAEDE